MHLVLLLLLNFFGNYNMQTIVYSILLVVLSRTSTCENIIQDSKGFANDSPYYSIDHEKHYITVKEGTPVTLKCPHNAPLLNFKPCHSNFQGLLCDKNNLWKNWQRTNAPNGRKHIDTVNRNHNGIYKCSDGRTVKRIYIINVVSTAYTGTKPYVAPLRTSNLTGQINIEFTIQCNVTSDVPPTIFWFKSCYGQKCDIQYNQICFCHLNSNTSISNYNIGTTYLSKYYIYNARDVDSGIYACLAVTQYGESSQNVTITVPAVTNVEENISYSMLFIIPIALVLIPISVWLCYYKKKKKQPAIVIIEQQTQLIRPNAQVNVEINDII